jgi:hypothetical protein
LDDIEVVTTPHYEQYPESIIESIVTDFGGMVSGDVDLPLFDNRYVVWHQWMDTTVKKMVDQVCERFGYYPTISVDNKLTARRISDSNATDHSTDVTKIIDFSPDDSFSNFINRVVVVGRTGTGSRSSAQRSASRNCPESSAGGAERKRSGCTSRMTWSGRAGMRGCRSPSV